MRQSSLILGVLLLLLLVVGGEHSGKLQPASSRSIKPFNRNGRKLKMRISAAPT